MMRTDNGCPCNTVLHLFLHRYGRHEIHRADLDYVLGLYLHVLLVSATVAKAIGIFHHV